MKETICKNCGQDTHGRPFHTCHPHRREHHPLRIGFIISIREKQTNNKKGNSMQLTVNLSSVQEIEITATPERADGSPATLIGAPTWSSSDATVATVTAAPDGLSAVISAQAPGTCTVTVSGEGDATPGNDTVSNSVAVNVVNAEATQIVLTAGTPTTKTPPAAS